jgi:hypothetical protein
MWRIFSNPDPHGELKKNENKIKRKEAEKLIVENNRKITQALKK